MTFSSGQTCASFTAAALTLDGDVEVGPLEARKFRVLTLANKIKVCLASDASSDRAAAALNVSVGHFSDPWDLPGLAHFCEHMLFLGTEKYPEEGSYRKFLAENSGFSNAYTCTENTNYHFQLLVPPNDLESDDKDHVPRFKEALDRFSQFFIAPLFTESATERELNAVDSEHQKNLQRDGMRIYQLQKSVSNPKHPYSKFSNGSKATLGADATAAGLDTRQALLNFHKKYYSANLMHLCIAGPYSLDVMEEWAVELFSAIPNHDAPNPTNEYRDLQPLLPEQTGLMVYVDPIKDIRRLEISWVIPSPDISYRSKPSYYVSHLLGHEGKGSLLSLLRQKGWVDCLAAGPCREVTPYAFFIITMDLTREGTDRIDDILYLVFGYLQLIREQGVQQWIFDETASLAALNFRFNECCEPYQFVQVMTAAMCKYPPVHYISGPYLLRDYVPDDIHEILDLMTPERCNVFLIGRCARHKTALEEPWYKTQYGKEPIPQEKISRWRSARPDRAVGIPPKNMFVPTDLSMLSEPLPNNEKDTEGPVVLEENKHFKLYYKLDRTFNRPKAVIHIDLYTSMAYSSPRNAILAKIFTCLVGDELSEYAYDAEIAGLHYNFFSTHTGLRLVVLGYNHNLRILLNTILVRMANFRTNPERLDMILDQLRREHENFDKDQPHQHAMYLITYLLEQPRWHVSEYLDALNDGSITAATVDAFVPVLLERMYLMCLVGGNVSAQWSREVMWGIKEILGYSPLPVSERVVRRISQLPKGCDVIARTTHPNPNDNNSAIKVLFQFGPRGDFVQDVTVELIAEILNKPTFHELRTVQQLGYVVQEGSTRHEGVRGVFIVVQSPQYGPDVLLERIKKFLVDVRKDMLANMSEEEFGAYVLSMRALKLEKEKTMFRQSGRYWSEIMYRECVFDREEQEANALQYVTKQSLLEVFDKYMAEGSIERRCLIAMVYGSLHKRLERGCGKKQAATSSDRRFIEVEDATAFRHWCSMFPVTGASVADVEKVPDTV